MHKQGWSLRQGTPDDRPVLEQMVYETLYWQPDAEREPFDFVIAHPEISCYVSGWGRPGDGAMIAVRDADGEAIGAAWYRLFTADEPGYGFVSTDIPEVGIAVDASYRDQGVGRALMVALCGLARESGFDRLSLSVEVANTRALHLYSSLGFRRVGGDEHNYTMLLDLNAGPAGVLRFVQMALDLKRVRRQGWIDRGVEQPESSADHSWSLALLAWLLAADRPELDRNRVLLLALVHDLPEALAGDTTPFDRYRDSTGVIPTEHFITDPDYTREGDADKRQREEAALEEMLGSLPAGVADEIREAWREYDDAETPEARFVKQVDKLETLIQAEDYLSRQPNLLMESFRRGARRDVTDPDLVALMDVLGSDG